MSKKVFKLSNYIGIDNKKRLDQYVTTLDSDVTKLFRWVQQSRVRSINLPITSFKKTNTDAATVGTTPTIDVTLLNATGDLLSCYVQMPKDWDKDTNVDLELVWSLVSTETNADTLDVTCDYTTVMKETTGEGIGHTSSSVTASVGATTAFGLAIGDIYTTTFTMDKTDTNNGWTFADKTVGLALEIHMTNISEVASIHLVGGSLNYIALY